MTALPYFCGFEGGNYGGWSNNDPGYPKIVAASRTGTGSLFLAATAGQNETSQTFTFSKPWRMTFWAYGIDTNNGLLQVELNGVQQYSKQDNYDWREYWLNGDAGTHTITIRNQSASSTGYRIDDIDIVESLNSYEDDFEYLQPYVNASHIGWTNGAIEVANLSGIGRHLGYSGSGTQATERTFELDGDFSYDWRLHSGTAQIKVYLDNSLLNTHTGPAGTTGTGNFAIAGASIPGGETVKFEFINTGGTSYINSMKIVPIATQSIDGVDIRTDQRVSTPDVVTRSPLSPLSIRTDNRTSEPNLIVSDAVFPMNVRTTNRITSADVKRRHPILVDNIRTANRTTPTDLLFIKSIRGTDIRTTPRIDSIAVSNSTWQPKGRPRPRLLFRSGLFLG